VYAAGYSKVDLSASYPVSTTTNAAAVDALGNVETVYDFYDKVLGRKQFDGNQGSMLSVYVDFTLSPVNWGKGTYNAFFNGEYNCLHFTISDQDIPSGSDKAPLEESRHLDVVGHEFTHGVSASTWNTPRWPGLTIDANDTGAINEGLSDVMGEMVELWRTDHNDWVISSRDFSKGLAGGKASEDSAHGGARLIDYVAYAIATGTGPKEISAKYAGTTIPWLRFTREADIANFSKLWYGAMNMLPQEPTLREAAHATIRMAELMRDAGRVSQEQVDLVKDAFAAVKITPNTGYNGYEKKKQTVDKIRALEPDPELVAEIGRLVSDIRAEQPGLKQLVNSEGEAESLLLYGDSRAE
jgi:hypothetical protein